MHYKQHLLANYEKLYKVKDLLNTMDTNYFTTTKINEKEITPNTISIVMTACNRSIQTYFTLDTINKSSHKDVQIILVDDSSTDPALISKLETFNMHIELINIKNKFWINPCVNYNIGFKHIKGSKVIIQNAEVCHMDDILNYVINNVNDEEYHSVNIYALNSIEQNKSLYDNPGQDVTKLKGMWYQHPIHRNAYFHFLVALTKKSFDKFSGFDIDYAVGVDYDDNALVHRVKNNNIKLINVPLLLGVHQWHAQSSAGSQSGNISNIVLWDCKQNYYNKHKMFLDLTVYPMDGIVGVIEGLF
jgi:glycosyltransferase involved in cell wall biosynthesis